MSELSVWQMIVAVIAGIVMITPLLIAIFSFGLAFVSLAQMIMRSGYPWDEPGDEGLSWVQRVGKRQTRSSLMLISPQFAKERKRLAIGIIGFLISFAIIYTFVLLTKNHS